MEDKFVYYLTESGETVAKLNPTWREQIKIAKYDYFLKKSEIPKDYYDLDFDSFPWLKSRESIEHAKTFCARSREEKFQGVCLYMYGASSSGKTTVACSIGKEFIKQGYTVKFVFAGYLNNLILKTSGAFIDQEAMTKLDDYKNADLLIVKDAFDSKKVVMPRNPESKEALVAATYNFVQDVISKGNRILFPTSLPLAEIQTVYNKAVFDLVDMNSVVLKFEDSVRHIQKDRLKDLFN